MPKFGKTSLKRLKTCSEPIQIVMNQAIKLYDFSILDGHRNEKAQTKAFDNGFSHLKYPNSKHNLFPSLAIDIAPYPIEWLDHERFILLAQYIHIIAFKEGFKFYNGGYWRDPKDYPHWEDQGKL